MTEEQLGSKGNTEEFAKRTLAQDVPGLSAHLFAGAQVLDVGCGPGSITLDVAAAVAPGRVVGVDVMEDRISDAAKLASDRDVGNAAFEVGDCHVLRFPDDTFDVVYSHTVLHSMIDPPRALVEQKRVAKPGGWVIASGVRDWGFSPRYPACPALDRLHEAWVRYHESMRTRYLSGDSVMDGPQRQLGEFRYLDLHAARKCVRWFREAGMGELRMQFTVESFEFLDSVDIDPSMTLVPPSSVPDDPLWEVYTNMMADGFVDEDTIGAAADEVVAWYGDADAFNLVGLLTVAGRA
jgi:SAM-dependent methyltransferase